MCTFSAARDALPRRCCGAALSPAAVSCCCRLLLSLALWLRRHVHITPAARWSVRSRDSVRERAWRGRELNGSARKGNGFPCGTRGPPRPPSGLRERPRAPPWRSRLRRSRRRRARARGRSRGTACGAPGCGGARRVAAAPTSAAHRAGSTGARGGRCERAGGAAGTGERVRNASWVGSSPPSCPRAPPRPCARPERPRTRLVQLHVSFSQVCILVLVDACGAACGRSACSIHTSLHTVTPMH